MLITGSLPDNLYLLTRITPITLNPQTGKVSTVLHKLMPEVVVYGDLVGARGARLVRHTNMSMQAYNKSLCTDFNQLKAYF